ncbi:hypothetical protein GPALN_006255 [Globodera pallida]|nr:hypothetical protein GPALN_006255 [Globodera pallida]
MVESIFLTMFHLRRVQFQAYVKEAKGRPVAESINDATEPSGIPAVRERSTMILLDKQTKIGRNPELVDVVLHSVVHSNMISRDHSEIVGETDGKGQFVRYYISDRSLNGTYVNDTRVKENVLLREGDLIKFGHVNGAAIKPGEHAPQHTAEFIFRFERSLPNFAYFGYSQKGTRVHQHQSEHPQLQRRAYMQINSDRVLPTEVYASLAAAGGASATGVGGGHGTVPRPIVSGCPAAVNSSSSAISGVTTATSTSAPGAHSSTATSFHPLHHSNSSASNNNNTTTAASVNPSGCANASANNNGAQLAHLAAVAAATTLANTVAAAAVATNGTAQQQRNQANGGAIDAATTSAASTLNALNQLGLTSATEEQVAAVNAHLRQLMSSHDAMSAMERLAAQQQWNNSLLKLSSLQQQNPLVYGHAFPAAAAAAAALFTGCIDLNSAAANNPNSAAAQYAASLWPSIRALQPSVSQSADWAQQQKAAAFAQQLQLRLPGLYQQQQQQQAAANAVQHRGSAGTLPSAAPSLFGSPSAFSLPGTHTNSAATLLPSSSAGLLIAAQQQCVSTSSSTAYASCTSSATSAVGIPPMRHHGESPISSLSRGTSSVSLSLHPAQGTSVVDQQQQNSTVALAARLAAAQQLAKELEADQHAKNSNNSIPGWSMGISCSSAAGPSAPVAKVSPLIGSSSGGGAADAGLGGATTPLQRIPGIASALAAAVAAAQQQQQHQQQHNMPPWPSGTPPNNGLHAPLDTPPIRQPLAQRIFSPAVSNSSSLSLSSGSSKSSSGVSSAPSSGLLQSPGTCGGGAAIGALNNSDVGKEFRDSFSSLLTTNCSSTSAFSSPQTANNTNLNTLTTAMFAAEREKVNASRHRTTTTTTTSNNSALDEAVAKVMTDDEKELAEREHNEAPPKTTPPPEWEKSDRELCNQHHHQQQQQSLLIDQKTSLNGFSSSMLSDLDQLRTETSGSKITHGDDHEDARKADEMASCEEKREQMECDSSVPSPPPGREQQQQQQLNLLEKESTGEDCKDQREKVDLPAELSSLRKRHSSAGSSLSPTDESIDAGRDGGKAEKEKSGSTKPRPIKQARKSNEVARLLNDLTAGNCTDGLGKRGAKESESLRKKGQKRQYLMEWKTFDSDEDESAAEHWQKHFGRDEFCRNEQYFGKNRRKTNSEGSWQYMAERSQKLAAKQTGGKSGGGGRGDGADSPEAETAEKSGRIGMEKVQQQQQQQQLSSQSARTERKRPLRLEERKRAEIERKRAHKMMRQISDESSDEEHNGGGGKRENVPNNGNSVGHQNVQQQQRHNNINKKIASPHLSSSDEDDDDDGRKSPDLDSNDSDHHHQRQRHANSSTRRRRKGSGDAKVKEHSPAKALTNGGTVPKRKLLSSAPGTKKAATMTPMNSLTTTATKLTNGGPKNSEVPRKRGPKGGVEEKGKAAAVRPSKLKATAAVVATSTALALKKKAGRKIGNGRGRPAGNLQKAADGGTSETADSSDDDSSVDQPVRLSNGSRGPMLNGGGPTLIREETRIKGGRHRGRRRDESSPDLATTTVAEDWTGGSGDPELCAHKGCQRPLHMAINWVQCDDCDQWFHSTCVFGTNKTPDGDADFHCGCAGTDSNSTKTSTDNKVANNGKSSPTASISSSA